MAVTEQMSSVRLHNVDALRGLAAVAVILSHAARHIDKAYGSPGLIDFFQAGHSGVDLFFVISGFIIYHVHREDIGRPGRLYSYLHRRFSRVFPLYWIVLAITIALSIPGHGVPPLLPIVWSAALLPSLNQPLLGIAWTLQFEVIFYAAFAVLIVSPWVGRLLFLGWMTVIAAGKVGLLGASAIPVIASEYGVDFFIGLTVAVLVRRRIVRLPRVIAVCGAVLFSADYVMESIGLINGFQSYARIIYGLSAGILLAGVAAADQAGTGFRLRVLRRAGSASYSLYLWQFVLIGTLWQGLIRTGLERVIPHWLTFVLLSSAAVCGGLVASRLVEMPLLRWMHERRRHRLGLLAQSKTSASA